MPVAPCGPSTPVTPCGPSTPVAPCGPCGPSTPVAPCAPSTPARPCAPWLDSVNTQAAPVMLLSLGPPIKAVVASADNATLDPNHVSMVAPVPVSFGPCCVHPPPERVKSQAAPKPPLSNAAPIMAVLPSADNATLPANQPPSVPPVSSVAVSFAPCCVQVPPERVNTQAAPTPPLSFGPPIRAVFPSPDSATVDAN